MIFYMENIVLLIIEYVVSFHLEFLHYYLIIHVAKNIILRFVCSKRSF